MKCLVLLALLAAFAPSLSGTQLITTGSALAPATDPVLTVTVTSATSVLLTWDAWGGAGDYQITVTNRTTSQVEQSFTTASLSAAVGSLNTGNTYRFSVAKNGFVIAEEIIL
ncbi:MAG: fibronectin type III domain-containing protein [Saprospiraceae bacterium]